MSGHEKPEGYQVGLAFNAEWEHHPGYAVGIEFADSAAPEPGDNGEIKPSGWTHTELGTPSAWLPHSFIKPEGWSHAGFGSHSIQNTSDALYPAGVPAPALGKPSAWNYRQYIAGRGYNSSLYGKPFIQGGVKYLSPRSVVGYASGRPTVINTTANQAVSARGIAWPGAGKPELHPKTLFVSGIYGFKSGFPFVQFPPSPQGWWSSAFGYPVVEFKTRYLGAEGFDAQDVYHPSIRDRAQYVRAQSVIRSSVFGDTALRNNRFYIEPDLFDAFEPSSWAEVRNTRRLLHAVGFDALTFGDHEARNKTPNLSPAGWDSLEQGYTLVAFSVRHVEPRGWSSLATAGTHTVERTPSIEPKGFVGASGEPTVWHYTRTLYQHGADHQLFGGTTAWHYRRHAQMDGFASGAVGSPRLEHELREVIVPGIQQPAIGTSKIEWRNRTLEPASIWENFASAHMVGGTRYLRPYGFEATRWGTRIIPEITSVYPLGLLSAQEGVPEVWNQNQVITTRVITTTEQPADQWGRAKVWNLLQHITLMYDSNSDLEPPEWPRWTLIENRNKVLGAVGGDMARAGRPHIFNNARLIQPDGVEPFAPAAFLVAYRVRYLPVEGVENPYISRWTRIYNDAFVVQTAGTDTAQFGVADLENTRRSFNFQGWDNQAPGFPMVSFAIRELTFESRYGIAPPIISPNHDIDLHTRYIEDAGDLDAFRQGWHSLQIRWNIIAPRWPHIEKFGDAHARNLTPEVRTRGRNHEEFGDTSVRLEFRFVETLETFTQIIPRPIIAYRDRQFEAVGFNALRFGDKLTVIKTGAPPYSEQRIDLSLYYGAGEEDDYRPEGYGIQPPGGRTPNVQVPEPSMNQQVLYAKSSEPMTLFGVPDVLSNVLRMTEGIVDYDPVGTHRVELKIRRIYCDPDKGAYKPIGPDLETQVPKQRLSPHTIYAVMESPQQARENHPLPHSRHLHYVDGYFRQPGALFGSTRVTLQNRTIKASGIPWAHNTNGFAHPRPTVKNAYHVIMPPGIRSWFFGWPQVPGTRYIEQAESADHAAVGSPKVAPPPYAGPQDIRPNLFDAAGFGLTAIELLHREVGPRGWGSQVMGASKPGDNPYMWQGLRVGPLVPVVAGGDYASLHGEPFVAYRIREIKTEGFDMFLSEYDIADFGGRMRVIIQEPHIEREVVLTHGAEHDQHGVPSVKLRTQHILPDGNSETYRKGAHHA